MDVSGVAVENPRRPRYKVANTIVRNVEDVGDECPIVGYIIMCHLLNLIVEFSTRRRVAAWN